MRDSIEPILHFWFGRGQTATAVAEEKTALWWDKNEQVDRQITDRFQVVTEAAVARQLDHWSESPRGLLALILCTDQFPRNMYRDTPQAFASDPLARHFANTCIDQGMAQQLKPIERVFVYLPFEHSEDIADQQRSLALYQSLAENAVADSKESELFSNYLDPVRRHHDIIQRFGRFPHRNKVLARPSTAEELAFLEEPGSSF